MSRRDVLAGVVALGAAVALPTLASARQQEPQEQDFVPDLMPQERVMANRSCHSAVVLQSGLVLIAGGFLGGRPTNSALMLDPRTGEFGAIAPMNMARARHACVQLPDGRVVVLGGFGSSFTASVELYNPSTNSWFVLKQMPSPRADFSAVVVDGGIQLIGGTGPISAPGQAFYALRSMSFAP